MRYLLNALYVVVLIALLPRLVWAGMRKGKYREGYAAKLWGQVPRRGGSAHCVWLHAVSVGEVNLLAPLIQQIRACHPDWDCVITTTTMTGFALARTRYADLVVCYCPLDFSWAVNHAMERLRPDLLVLAELELWPNLISAARRRGAKVAVVNGRLSERSFRGYRRFSLVYRRVLSQLNLVAAQNEQYAERFRALGARSAAVHVTGSIKFDGAQTDRGNPATARLRQLAGITSDDIVWLAGSTQPIEEELVLRTYLALREEFPRLRLILVPRHPEHFAITRRMLDAAGVAWQRRTELDRSGSFPAARVLLVNVVGELGAWWGTADVAFVGGSLTDRGGQNMIEPAAYGAAVSFGPNTWNFRDVVEAMLAADAAVVVRDGDQMAAFVRRALTDPRWAAAMGQRAQLLVRGQLGATQRTFDLLETLLPAEAPATAAAA